MNILSEPQLNYVILISFLKFLFQNRERIVISNSPDSQFIQNRATLVYMLLLLHIINFKKLNF